MLWVPQKGKLRVQTNMDISNTTGTSVTTGAAASTKGSIAELIAATLFDVYWLRVCVAGWGSSAVASQAALDILIGAAGSEQVKIANLLFGYAEARGGKYWDFPLFIPYNTRISARAASVRTATSTFVQLYLFGGAAPHYRVGQKVTTYGMGAVPDGTAITPGNAVMGSWAQIAAATSEEHFCLVPSFQPSGDTTIANNNILCELGIGGAGSEETIGPPYIWTEASDEMQTGPQCTMPVFQEIPAGTRLAFRAGAQGAPSSGYNAVIHAVS